MKIILVNCFLFFFFFANSQNDSIRYFLKQLSKKNLTDSSRAYFNLKVSDSYADIDPHKCAYYAHISFQIAQKINSETILYGSTNNLSNALRDQGRLDSSLFYANQSYKFAINTQDQDLIYNSLNLLGNIYLHKLQLQQAKKFYDEALEMTKLHSQLSHRSHIYQNLSNYYFRISDFKKSINILKQGELIAAKDTKDDLMGIYMSLGQRYIFMGKIDSAQRYILPVLEYYRKKGNIRDQAIINQTLGLAYSFSSNLLKTEEYFERAISQFALIGDRIGWIRAQMLKANFFFRTHHFDKCLQTLKIVEPFAIKYDDKPTIATIYLNKAGIYTLLNDTTTAKKYQQLAEEINQKISVPAFDQMNFLVKGVLLNAQQKINRGDSLIKKTLIAAGKQIPSEIIQSSIESFSLSKKQLLDYKHNFIDDSQPLADKDNTTAKKVFDSLANQPLDSNLNVIYNKQLLELETKYDLRLKEDSISTQKQLIAIKNKSISTRNYLLGLLGLLTLLILILYVTSRKQSLKIKYQYSEIQQLQTELTHRAGNFFNSIKGMLSAASMNTTDDKTISSLQKRVNTINRLFTTLYSSSSGSHLPFPSLLASICADFEHSFGAEKKISVHHLCEAPVNRNESIPLAFIITELLTNAEKYAFTGKVNGEIYVEVVEENGNRFLYVWDNGVGLTENLQQRPGSQGMSIIKSYCKNLNGKITTWNDNGFHFKMSF